MKALVYRSGYEIEKTLVYRNGYVIEENMATCESGGKEHEWELSLWPDGKVNEGRKWIVVPISRGVNGKGCWGGLPAFSVRLKGMNVASDSYYIEPDENAMPEFNAKSIFGLACTQLGDTSLSGFQLKVNGSYNYMSDEACKGVAPSWMFDWNEWKTKSVSMTVKIPETGLLAIRGISASEIGDWAAWQISGKGVSYESGAQLKISCAGATTVTLRNDADDKFTMSDLAFYPAASKSVHVVADIVVSRRVENAAGEAFYPLYVNGYVTGGGTFKPGERLSMVANVAPGMTFDHWEITDQDSWDEPSEIAFPDGTDTKGKTLSFVVPASFCGEMADMKVIHVRPILVEDPSGADPDAPSPVEPKPFTVTFDANGGTASAASATYAKGEALGDLPTASRDGHAFAGWFTKPNGGTRATSATKVTRSVTYYARWTEIVVPVAGSGRLAATFDGLAKRTFGGLALDADGRMAGLAQLATAKASKDGSVSVKGFVMLADGRKQSVKAAKGTVQDGLLTVRTTVGKLGALDVTFGGDGFVGRLGGLSVESADVGEDTGILRGTIRLSYLDAKTGAVKTRQLTLTGLTDSGEAVGTLSAKGKEAQSFQAVVE